MKIRNVYKIFGLIALSIVLQGRSSGPGAVASLQVSGAPGSGGSLGTCGNSGCHTAGAFNPSLSLQLLDGTTLEPVDNYIPGENYQLRLNFSAGAGVQGYGMQAVILDEADQNVGAWIESSLPPSIQITDLSNRRYIEHSQPESSTVWGVDWTAPAAGSGPITVYAAGIASNLNGNSGGDGVTSAFLTIPEQSTNAVSENDRNFADMTIAPNPVADWARLAINSQISGEFQLNVMSVNGKMVFSENVNLQAGETDKALNLSHLSSGLYFLQLVGEGRISTEQLIKL